MAVWSLLLGVLAMISTVLGVITTPIAVLGAVFAFGAPALALSGVVAGGVAMSRRRRAGQATDGATAGVIVSALAFFPALITALTCGVCNAVCSSADLQSGSGFKYAIGTSGFPDAGVGATPSTWPPPAPVAPQPSQAPGDSAPPSGSPPSSQPGAPPPAFPPPPLQP